MLVAEKRPLLLLGFLGFLLIALGIGFFVQVLLIFNATRAFAVGTAVVGVVSTFHVGNAGGLKGLCWRAFANNYIFLVAILKW